jgi:invasion protein IalB
MIIRRLVANAGLRVSLLAVAASFTFAIPAFAQSKQAPAPVSKHAESVNFDHWVVSCQDVGGKSACAGTLHVLGPDGKQPIANWQIGLDKDGRLVSVVQVPPGLAIKSKDNKVSGGLAIKNGVDLKIGSAAVRHLNYVACTPQVCEATGAPIDDAFVKEAAGAASSTITVFTADGTAVPLTFSGAGLDKALAAVASKKI